MVFLFLLGRILYGGFFLLSGIGHLRNFEKMAPFARSRGVPSPKLAVFGSGILIILGGLSILLGVYPDWGVLLISLFLIPTTLMMHSFWADTDPNTRQGNLINFKKNVALLGAAWMFLLIPQPWPWSL